MKYDFKIILKRLLTGVLSAVVATLGSGIVDPKLLCAAAIAGGAAAFGIDATVFHEAKKANKETRATLEAHNVPAHIIDAVTVQTSAPGVQPGNV